LRAGRHAEVIDKLIDDKQIVVSASVHLMEGRVKLCREAAEGKAFPLTFMNSGGASDDDVLRTAFLCGVCAALDAGRKTA
jgi:hypothetical protein